MAPEMWRSVRWLVALGACLLVVVVSVPLAVDAVTSSIVIGGEADDAAEEDGDDGGGEQPAGPAPGPPTGPVTAGEAPAELDVVVVDGTVSQADTQELVLDAEGAMALVAFPRIEGDPACVALAELELALTASDPTELAVYAATLPAELEDGVEVGDPRTDAEVRALAVTDGTPGRLLWGVTDLYRAWGAGEFGTVGSTFAVVVAPPTGNPAVSLGASESDDGPSLSWQGEEGCGS